MTRYSPSLLLTLILVAAPVRAASLPDTGQTLCDNGSNQLVACTTANTGDAATYPRQDARFGRDAKATAGTLTKTGGGAAGFDYSKIANDGSDLGAGVGLLLGNGPQDWACTRDNITGLTWEVKVNDVSNLRHMNWTYTWYNSDGSTNGGNAGVVSGTTNCLAAGRCDTEKYVADVNATLLCGSSAWRMPTLRELRTLVNAGRGNPSIDVTYFPNTQSWAFWSGSPFVSLTTEAWFVFFGSGYSLAEVKTKTDFYVRLVHGGQF